MVRSGTLANTLGIQTEFLLVSQRLDSQTYFVQDKRFKDGSEGLYEGSDEDLIGTCGSILSILGVPGEDVSGNVIGYAKVSTRGQSLDSQVDALVAAGVVRVFQEYASGAIQARTRWKECLDYLQPGNVLTVADLTRLGRSTADLADIVTVLDSGG